MLQFFSTYLKFFKKLAKWYWRIQKLKKLYRLIDTVNDEKKSEKSFVNEYKVVQYNYPQILILILYITLFMTSQEKRTLHRKSCIVIPVYVSV